MPEERIVPEVYTTKELVLGCPDMSWEGKIDEIRSEVGGYVSVAAAGSGTVTTALTKTGLLTGKGTLTSAGMKFLMRHIFVAHPSASVMSLTVLDGATTAMVLIVHGSANAWPMNLNLSASRRFSSSVHFKAGGGIARVAVAGLRLVIQA